MSDRRPKKAAGHTLRHKSDEDERQARPNASVRALAMTMPVPIAITARLERTARGGDAHTRHPLPVSLGAVRAPWRFLD
jgi:hypothetical protein